MATDRPHPAPLARAAIRRHHPRQEPDALDAHVGICAGGCPSPNGRRAVPTATDFFTGLDQSWLAKFLEHRIADKRVLRLIQKWLRAGVIEDGEWSKTETGTA